MLDVRELDEIRKVIQDRIDNGLDEILYNLNRSEKLDDFLNYIGVSSQKDKNADYLTNAGKIVVIGKADVSKEILRAVATKDFGINKDRIVFLLDYNAAKKYDFKKMQYNDGYCCVFVGPMPHSGKSKADHGSIITAIEQGEGYPPVIRLGSGALSITKTSFRQALSYAKEHKIVA